MKIRNYIPRIDNSVNIIIDRSRKGLYHDGKILHKTLTEAGIKARIVYCHRPDYYLIKSKINIFIQNVPPALLSFAPFNFLLSNPEWDFHDVDFIKNNIDCVIAKTKDCENIYRTESINVYYTSFTSTDVNSEIEPIREYVHFAGNSPLKGTRAVINLWNRKKDLPPLFLYSYADKCYEDDIKTDNIKYTYSKFDDGQMKELQNKFLFHVSPSEYEGFGHQINESKSVGAIVFTTNAPPMNELITSEYGYLIKAHYKEKLRKGTLYAIVENDLYEKVKESETLSKANIRHKREKTIMSYKDNHRFFKERIKDLVERHL